MTMARSQLRAKNSQQSGDGRRSLLARPLDVLAFLLPLIVFYELASLLQPERVIAFELMDRFLALFGDIGIWAPGLAVVTILLATQAASRKPWTIQWNHVAWMYAESAICAAPLLLLNWASPLAMVEGSADHILDNVALGVGAGIYEELVFRLIMISVIVIVGADLLRLRPKPVALFAIVLSSLLFAAHHHQPIGAELFDASRFIFRTMAGAYLAVIFWYRGYGAAAGTHAAYNVALVMVATVRV